MKIRHSKQNRREKKQRKERWEPQTRLGKAGCLIALNIVWILFFSFILTQPSILKAELREVQGETNYDTIVVGDSHGETAVDPAVLDEELGTTSYNCSRRIMPVKDIYYLMREVCYHNQPKTILYEIDPTYWRIPGISLGNDTSIFFAGSDPKNRLDYFFKEMLTQPFPNFIADYRLAPRNASQIPGAAYVRLRPSYWHHGEETIPMIMKALYLGANYEYKGRGFRYGHSYSFHMDTLYKPVKFKAGKIVPENVEYFHKMAEFCKSRGIRLVCFYSALPPYRLLRENENAANKYYSDLCKKEGVEFYDMNYLKKEYLDRTDMDYVDLDGHMMGSLGDRQTRVLAKILSSDDPSSMFVDSYDVVLKNLPKDEATSGSALLKEARRYTKKKQKETERALDSPEVTETSYADPAEADTL
ncbi:hypothetical protein [Porcincola intestinalis]|jgi:hypothetical protein|uniref:hypothetical protein n=1 Tax=Porcincola intestinalis TaxID=2606632 RepID=UPI002A82992B|nr:hypothetical protein [Porcincola intestinalis]MDY4205017.1 hypothetical protein [Porcincola intestinalis]